MVFDLEKINSVFLSYFFDLEADADPMIINCGWCFHWAFTVHHLYGGTLCSIFVDGKLHHAAIKFGDFYYDAASCAGISFPSHLKTFDFLKEKNPKIELIEESCVEDFLKRWDFIPEVSVIKEIEQKIIRMR